MFLSPIITLNLALGSSKILPCGSYSSPIGMGQISSCEPHGLTQIPCCYTPMPPAPLALVEFLALSGFRVADKPTNSSDSLALALLGKNYLLSLLPVTCGVKIFPTNASFSFVTMSLLLTLSIQNGPASPGSWTLFAT